MNRKGILFLGLVLLFAAPPFAQESTLSKATVTDIDGNIYATVKIGDQVWMAENLKVSRFRNGDAIPYIKDAAVWEMLMTPGWSYCDNDLALKEKYGGFYNWFSVNDARGLCPPGWHVPTDEEFNGMAASLGGKKNAGEALKVEDDNSFAALSSGTRLYTGEFKFRGVFTGFWSSSEANDEFAWPRFLNYADDSSLHRLFYGKKNGLSCRCVKN